MKNIKIDKKNTPHREVTVRKAYIGCIFKRRKNDKEWEYGLAIVHPHNVGTSNVDAIIDLDNKLVKRIWSYELNTTSTIVDNHLLI